MVFETPEQAREIVIEALEYLAAEILGWQRGKAEEFLEGALDFVYGSDS